MAPIMVPPGTGNSPFVWKDFSRFVEVAPVKLGWLVIWGRYRDQGSTLALAGQRTYASLEGARRRVADAILELTRSPILVHEAMTQFDRTPFPVHRGDNVPASL